MNNTPKVSEQAQRRRKNTRGLIGIVVIIALGFAAYLYEPTIVDAFRASRFIPTAEVAAITERIELTDSAKRTFYAANPVIESRDEFNQSCQSGERTAAILGCYAYERIYLYDIDDSELDGAVEVTAAHELLHAGYARLNVFQKARVNTMIEAVYEKIKNTPVIAEEMEYYKVAEPGEELNELHSIIGTTIKDLPADLEKYYADYFIDRANIVAMNTRYTAVFEKLNAQATDLEKKINNEAAAIKVASDNYNRDLAQLNESINTFNRRAQNGAFSSQYAFSVERNALAAQANELTTRQVALNARIDAYNADIARYNQLALRAKQLNASINGVQAPGKI